MRIVAVVQARHSSQRLPGKVLRPLAGKPLLAHVFEAIAQCRVIDGAILATSARQDDDAVAALAVTMGVPVHRGDLDDVFSRMLSAGLAAQADAIVRISGDSPLIDPAVIDQGARLMRGTPDTDLVTNVFPRSFPKGQSVEVVTTKALRAAHPFLKERADREHVTTYFYANATRYRICNFTADVPASDVQLSVDTADDFDRCEAILRELGGPAWRAGWKMCVASYARLTQREETV
jgi:spore coat polysaccharide biosynthesis protein SpsF